MEKPDYQPLFKGVVTHLIDMPNKIFSIDFQTFKNSLSNTKPPKNVSELLQAIWYDGKEIGIILMRLLRMYLPEMEIESTLICIEKKAINGMRNIGIEEQDDLFQGIVWKKNGKS